MPGYRSPFSQLNPKQLKSLTLRVTAYAVRKLGNRIGASPTMYPQDLFQRAMLDTLDRRRNWDATRDSIEKHLIGCINSYISHYFDSKEARTRTRQSTGPNGDNSFLEQQARDHASPDIIISNKYLMESVRKMIRNDGDPELLKAWDTFVENGWDLDKDRTYFCDALGLDPATGSAGYQRFNRLRNKIRNYTKICLAEDYPDGSNRTH